MKVAVSLLHALFCAMSRFPHSEHCFFFIEWASGRAAVFGVTPFFLD
jgi:hypothetical protein